MQLRATRLTAIASATKRFIATFSPSSLFANNEQGVWYDPSDMSTMFQDSAGTTPVTAVEQPVGLILDKSKNLDIDGDYYRTDFSSSSGWVLGEGHTIADGKFKLTSALNGSLSYGKVGGAKGYKKITVVVDSVASGGFYVALNNSGALSPLINSAGTYVYFIADYAGTSRAGITASGASTTATISSLVIEVVSGNHATQVTTTSRPVLSARVNLLTKTDNLTDAAWTKQPGTSVNVTPVPDPDGALTAWFVVGNGANGILQGLSGTASLRQTTRSVYMRTRSGTATVLLKDPAQTQGIVTCNLTTTWQRFELTETTTPAAGFSAGIWIDDIPATGIEIAQPDLRQANQSNLPYQRVNTATDYDTTGFPHYLRFDGVDDWLVTPTITPGIDKVQVFAGVRKLSDATRGVILESSGSIDTNNGALLLTAPDSASSTYAWDSKGTAISEAIVSGFAAPITSVLTGIGDIAADSAILRVNGTQAAQSTVDQGTGNYLANQLRIGRRAGTSLPANINLYGLIVRFGANLPTETIASTETWLNGKTRAY